MKDVRNIAVPITASAPDIIGTPVGPPPPYWLTRKAHLARLTATVLLMAVSVGIAADSFRMGLWAENIPGPGFWPLAVAVLLFAALVDAILRERRSAPEVMVETSFWRECIAFASLAIYLVAFGILGMATSTFFFLILWVKYLAGGSWRLTLVLSVIGIGVLYVLFEVLLGVPFPRGVLI